MRIIVADCSAEYSGRLNAFLPLAKRVLLIKADNSLLIFSELGSYKPLNWMAAPCTIKDITPDNADDDVDTAVPQKVIRASADKSNDVLEVTLQHIYSDESYDLGEDPGLTKDGVEDHLQRYLAEQIERIGKGAKLVRREYPTAIGPVDIMATDAEGTHVAIEIKRKRWYRRRRAAHQILRTAQPRSAACSGPWHLRRADHHPAGPRTRRGPWLPLPDPRLRGDEGRGGRLPASVLTKIPGSPNPKPAFSNHRR